jgi:PAS domain S-box-containing protein
MRGRTTRRRTRPAAEIATLRKALDVARQEYRQQAERWLEANARLEASIEIYRNLYEDAPVGYFTLSEDGIVLDANTQAAAMFGREPAGVRGRPLLFFVERSAATAILRHLMRCRAGEAIVVTEVVFRKGDEPISVELASRRTWAAGAQPVYRTVAHDLTERRTADRLLAVSVKQYREIVDTANEGICKVGPANLITFVNPAFMRLTGFLKDELVAQPFELLLPPDGVAAEQEAFKLRDTGRQGVREQRLRRADGTFVWTSVSTSLLLDVDGGFAGMLRMYTDITDRKQLEAARENLVRDLVAAQEAERHRVARELHDQMGQHLVGLSLGLNRLAQLGGNSAEVAQITQRLQSLAETMARDVQHLAFELRPASLDDLGLGDAVSNYADEVARQSGIEVDVQCDRMPRLDPNAETAIYRIVQEALTNVTKHARAQRVSVILEPRGDRLHVIVEDDGVGFKPEVVAHAHNGHRLGLRGMIERAALVGGEFQIESRPGRGTTLFLRVPLRRGKKADDEEATIATG